MSILDYSVMRKKKKMLLKIQELEPESAPEIQELHLAPGLALDLELEPAPDLGGQGEL